MFTVSRSQRTTDATAAWHERRAWQRYAHDLLRYYSRSSRYRLRIDASDASDAPLAFVNPETRLVQVQAAFPRPTGHFLIARYIVPWAAAWLYFYEVWLDLGVWLGPEVPHR